MKKSKLVLMLVLSVLVLSVLVGCGRTGHIIKPNESAFLIPYNGNTNQQSSFASEEFLNKNKIATKRIIIEKTYIRGLGNVPEALLIKVNRAPVTREWTENNKTGTTKKNQGIKVDKLNVEDEYQELSFVTDSNEPVITKKRKKKRRRNQYQKGKK